MATLTKQIIENAYMRNDQFTIPENIQRAIGQCIITDDQTLLIEEYHRLSKKYRRYPRLMIPEGLLERRVFLKQIMLLTGLAFMSSLMPSCFRTDEQMPKPTSPMPSPNSQIINGSETSGTKISLVRTSDRKEGVRRAIALLQSNPIEGKSVTLKPNFNTADPTPASTHNDTLSALILALQEMGATQITLAERSGPPDTRKVMEQKGIFQLAQQLGVQVINLQEIEPEDWVHLEPKDSHWEHGFHFAKVYLEAESIVQTCCLKTHAHGGHFTLSLKNSVGMVPRTDYPYMGELHRSPYQRQMIAEINTAYSPDLIVLDGVEAFVDGGPGQGTRVKSEVVLAGKDRVAIDAVGVAILRLFGTTPEVSQGPIFKQEQIARAIELGLGVKYPAQIHLITDDPESKAFAEKVTDILLKE